MRGWAETGARRGRARAKAERIVAEGREQGKRIQVEVGEWEVRTEVAFLQDEIWREAI